jgi:hypothetical protein
VDEWEHPAQSRVEQQRLLALDQEMIEGEASRRCDVRHKYRDPVDASRNLVDPRFYQDLHARAASWVSLLERTRVCSRPRIWADYNEIRVPFIGTGA